MVTAGAYDGNTGLLTGLNAGPSNAVAQFGYSWDVLGNLTARSDVHAGANVYEKYCYDPLNRLIASATAATNPAACTSSGSGITAKTVAYDALGNIASKSDVGTYSYPTSGSSSVRPHAVSSIAGTVNGVVNPSYTYDGNGNLTAGAGRTVTPTSFNMAASIVQGSTATCFTYDDSHMRVQMDARATSCSGTLSSSTVYLNDPISGAMGEKVVAGATTTWHDFVTVDGAIAAERFCTGAAPCTSGATWSWFVTDHLGSTAVLTNAAGTVTERDSYDAWGRRRNSDGTDAACGAIASATTRGFTGHEMLDSLCEINANARIYDPTIAKFMSVDPLIQDLLDGQSFNRYAYVTNNPLSLTDPTGMDDCASPPPNGSGIETVVVCGKKSKDPEFDPAPLGATANLSSVHVRIPSFSVAPPKPTPTPKTPPKPDPKDTNEDDEPKYCIGPDGMIYQQSGFGAAVGQAVSSTAMPTATKSGGLAGGGASGRVTSPASIVARGATGNARLGGLEIFTGTSSIGGSAARALPVLGAFLTVLDAMVYEKEQSEQEQNLSGCIV